MQTVGVFAGPSLPPVDRIDAPGVTYLPPASRGDLSAAAERFDALLLIDGVFHHALAPSPKEMLDACRRIAVYGAASMGALRAAECRAYGAVPLGIIARWYAAGVIDGDDEVAVLMDAATSRALSVPSVNVRYVARLAARRGVLDAATASVWADRARREIFYMDRTWPAAIALAPAVARDALTAIARTCGDLKRWDARFALRRVQRTCVR
jgi:hypothetical protein